MLPQLELTTAWADGPALLVWLRCLPVQEFVLVTSYAQLVTSLQEEEVNCSQKSSKDVPGIDFLSLQIGHQKWVCC